jgi:hypothetical protein
MTETRQRLLILAMQFWQEVEAPSDDDIETLFSLLINHRLAALEEFVTNTGAASAIRNAEKDL